MNKPLKTVILKTKKKSMNQDDVVNDSQGILEN